MATTLGTICVLAHSTPNTSVNFFRLMVAASRMLYTVSPNQDMHRLESCSSKNSLPNCVASSGMYSMIACRTRHDLSSASSTMAGKRLSASSWIPMTEEYRISVRGSIQREHTFINLLEFTDNVQPNIGKFILQQVQEELKKMIDGGTMAEERRKPCNLVCKRGPDMLRAVLTKIPNIGYYTGNDDLRFQQFRETFKDENRELRSPIGNCCHNTWYLPCCRCANFSFIVFQ